MSISVGGFQLSPANGGGATPAPAPPAASEGGAPIQDRAELSTGGPRFPEWTKEELTFLNSVGSRMTGPELGKLTRCIRKFGDKLPAFVDLKSPQHRDEVYWDSKKMDNSAFRLSEYLQMTGGAGEFAQKMSAGIDPSLLETYRPSARPLTDRELSDLSKLAGRTELKGPELKLVRQCLLKQHGHDLENYVKDNFPDHRHGVGWQKPAAHSALDLLVRMQSQAPGDLGTVIQKLVEAGSASISSRDMGTG